MRTIRATGGRAKPSSICWGDPEQERSHIQLRHHLSLRERDTGYTFDMTTAEAETAFPWLQDYWNTYGPIFGRPPGCESLADVARRVYLFLSMLFRDRGGQRVLVTAVRTCTSARRWRHSSRSS